jgi:hypothetical protein
VKCLGSSDGNQIFTNIGPTNHTSYTESNSKCEAVTLLGKGSDFQWIVPRISVPLSAERVRSDWIQGKVKRRVNKQVRDVIS